MFLTEIFIYIYLFVVDKACLRGYSYHRVMVLNDRAKNHCRFLGFSTFYIGENSALATHIYHFLISNHIVVRKNLMKTIMNKIEFYET